MDCGVSLPCWEIWWPAAWWICRQLLRTPPCAPATAMQHRSSIAIHILLLPPGIVQVHCLTGNPGGCPGPFPIAYLL